jgi:hypothetical protein
MGHAQACGEHDLAPYLLSIKLEDRSMKKENSLPMLA